MKVLLLLPGLLACFAIVEPNFFLSSQAHASGLLTPSAGSADAALAGATIAEPLGPLGAMFSNPAGLARFTETEGGVGLGLAYGVGEVRGTIDGTPNAYHAENQVLVPFLQSFLVVPRGRWTFGLSTMATSGARFDYSARPAVGVDDGFFSESSVMGAPVGASYRVSDTLWLGAEIIALYGSTHLRFSREVPEFPGSATPFRFTVAGFGVQGMFGATWKPTDRWTFGLGFKPQGRIWASGDSALGGGKQDVDLELESPAEITAGITRALGDRWKVSYGLRFINTSVLETSYFRFEKTPSADMPFVSDAKDEWRHALGVEYAWSETLSLLGGVSYANGIVGDKGVNPATYDAEHDVRLDAGAMYRGETWTIASAFGFIAGETREISQGEALVFPGQYDSKPACLLTVTISKKL